VGSDGYYGIELFALILPATLIDFKLVGLLGKEK
jgi:hypothetical protein